MFSRLFLNPYLQGKSDLLFFFKFDLLFISYSFRRHEWCAEWSTEPNHATRWCIIKTVVTWQDGSCEWVMTPVLQNTNICTHKSQHQCNMDPENKILWPLEKFEEILTHSYLVFEEVLLNWGLKVSLLLLSTLSLDVEGPSYSALYATGQERIH